MDSKEAFKKYLQSVLSKLDKLMDCVDYLTKLVENSQINRNHTEKRGSLNLEYIRQRPVPDVRPLQIYKMIERGDSWNYVVLLTGLTPEEAKKKYDSHVRNNVRVN